MMNIFTDIDNQLIREKQKIEEQLEEDRLIDEINQEAAQKKQEKMEKKLDELKTDYQKIENQLENLTTNFQSQIQLNEIDKQKNSHILNQVLVKDFQAFNTNEQSQYPVVYINLKEANFFKAAQQMQILNQMTKQVSGDDYQLSVRNIRYQFNEITRFIFSQFRQSFFQLNTGNLKSLLVLIDQFEIVDQISMYYIENFLSDLKVMQQYQNKPIDSVKSDIDSLFFLLLKAFKKALSYKLSDQKNYYQLEEIFGGYSQIVLRQFVKYAFENIIDCTVQNILDTSYRLGNQKQWLNGFTYLWNACQQLGKDISEIDFQENYSFQAQVTDLYYQFLKSTFESKQNIYFDIELDFLESNLKENIYTIINQLQEDQYEHQKENISKRAKIKAEIRKFIDNVKKEEEHQKLNTIQIQSRINQLLQILIQENIETMFQGTQEALERSQLLSPINHKEEHKNIILDTFLSNFGKDLMVSIIDLASQIVPSLNRKTKLNPQFFQVVPELNTLIQRMDILFSSFIKGVRDNISIEQLENKRESLIQTLEMKIQQMIQNALASVFINSNLILKENQEKKDFYIKKLDNFNEGFQETQAINQYIAYIRQYSREIKQHSSASNKSRLLDSIGEQIIKTLMDHYPDYKITMPGSFQVLADISFVEKFLFNELYVKTLANQFSTLRNLANIFKVDLPSLEKYLEQQSLFKGVSNDLKEAYIQARKELKSDI